MSRGPSPYQKEPLLVPARKPSEVEEIKVSSTVEEPVQVAEKANGKSRARMRSGCLILEDEEIPAEPLQDCGESKVDTMAAAPNKEPSTGGSSAVEPSKGPEEATAGQGVSSISEEHQASASSSATEPLPAAAASSTAIVEDAAPATTSSASATASAVAGPELEVVQQPEEEKEPSPQQSSAETAHHIQAAAEGPKMERDPSKSRLKQPQQHSSSASSSRQNSTEQPPPLLWRHHSPLPEKRPEDNYEISEKDADSADEDEAAEDARRKGKHIPDWSRNYLEVLQTQKSLDPDSIFGSMVHACNLEVVFPDSLYRRCGKERPRRKRGSSQDWKKDRLRSREVAEYKKKLGQTKRWSTANRSQMLQLQSDA